ncbi:Alpha/Beta hydrolase protein [Lipomyces starkeyi]|uniref:Carboxylesterase type B domain-containing protein n=1 Tax=Lipomyces starkeyi NRRL Y-11557 TaxID=675824 RepID=A0A1E3PX76_LIPST|nr:hypothetical protein LIPSTDRAFT_65731 [Lipomyces starkeyi NRRL Y-11557]
MILLGLALLHALAVGAPTSTISSPASSLPIVDLGYTVNRATLNTSVNNIYNSPQTHILITISRIYVLAKHLSVIFGFKHHFHHQRVGIRTANDGQQGVICPQATPGWIDVAGLYLTGTTDLAVLAAVSLYRRQFMMARMQSVSANLALRALEMAPLARLSLFGYSAVESEVHGGIIFVAMNYRLGVFGFLAREVGITPNDGILDQRLAMEWVQDPNQVSIMGESSGGGSVLYHMTAYGGNGGKSHFKEASFKFTNKHGAGIEEFVIRVYATNCMIVGNSDYGSFTYNPGPDGFYVPDFPSRLLFEGRFDHSISIMVGHNINDGAIFSSPFITTQADYGTAVEQIIPSASQEVIAYITETLYPNVLNGSFSYTTQTFQGLAYSYLFSIPSGYNGVDVAYTFYDGPAKDEGYPVKATLAGIFQNYIGNFGATGSPNYAGLPYLIFPELRSQYDGAEPQCD